MNSVTPPALDSRRVALELATRLCSKDHLLHGISDIIKFEQSEDCELQRYGRKIISLTEVARSTLKRLKVELYLFVVCSQDLLPLKSAYFKLLLFIERRKNAFGSDLKERISRLLNPLYTRFVICCRGVDPRAQLGIEGLPAPPDVPAAWKSTIQPIVPTTAVSSAQEDATSDIMLPPDAFAKRKESLARLGEFIKEQSARKFRLKRARLLLKANAGGKRLVPRQYATGNTDAANPGEKRLVPRQYAAGNPEGQRLVPKQYATGNPERQRLVTKQYATGNPEGRRLVPKQYATGNPERQRLIPKQYATGNPEIQRLVPKQYATGNPEVRRVVPKQHATGNPEAKRFVPKQNATGTPEERRLAAPKQYAIGKPGLKRLVPQQYPAGRPSKKRRVQYPVDDIKPGNKVEPSHPRRELTRTYAQYFNDL